MQSRTDELKTLAVISILDDSKSGWAACKTFTAQSPTKIS
jgi:hypothetical protein